ncbi:GNAT family N-acetyltransferase [Burkholderia sp. 22PA0106]|uniref:bifunctional acetate--CoA ligase family protein/GNAT family N-acetyltransferase n=1 Tax=Burkholderia sp. 22PA0106 TaxID=3237371 RepID=UPI0039C0BA25
MTVRNLDALFQPKSVAVVGASRREGSIGAIVWRRVLDGDFGGPVWPVNPKYDELSDLRVYARVSQLPAPPSMAVVCTPPATWPGIVKQLGALGARGAILVGEARTAGERASVERALEAAKPYLLRIVGPGSLGIVTPRLNAHFGAPAYRATAGGVAWVSQSNALTNAALGWAHARGLGFSHAVALGDEADVDAGDVLDYLASDPSTKAILLELDSVKSARKFMSAARAAARNKPVLALRTGRADPGDALYTAAFQRAGMVRVEALDDLLDEIETLGIGRIATSNAATVITSDAGVAKLAVDALGAAGDLTLAPWSPAATAALAAVMPMPRGIEAGNPLLLGDDARPEAFGAAVRALGAQGHAGTLFVVHATSHSAPVDAVARELIEAQRTAPRGIVACFFGGVDAAVRDALHTNGIPVHTTPQRLARAYARLVDYRLGRELLMQTPEGLPPETPASVAQAQEEARAAAARGPVESSGEEAANWLAHFGLRAARDGAPDADSLIVTVGVEMMDDQNFGPVFRYSVPSADGASSPFVVYALPPFNTVLARAVVRRSPYAQRAAPEPLLEALMALSQAVCEVRELVGLSLALRVLTQRVEIGDVHLRFATGRGRLAIMPYPRRLEQRVDWRGTTMTVRPIRPEDEAAHTALLGAMTPDDLRMRFFGSIRSFDHSQVARMTQIDYDREMALIATAEVVGGQRQTLGVVRAVADPDNETAEFAIAIRPDQKGNGLGRLLMAQIIDYARSRGTRWLIGEALRENGAMIGLARAAGFTVSSGEEPSVVAFRMKLQA